MLAHIQQQDQHEDSFEAADAQLVDTAGVGCSAGKKDITHKKESKRLHGKALKSCCPQTGLSIFMRKPCHACCLVSSLHAHHTVGM